MKKYLTLIAVILALTTESFSQQIKKNSIYLELLGNSVIYSINYDRIVPISAQLKLVPRVGFMYLPIKAIKSNYDYTSLRVPIELNMLWAKKAESKNFVEAGIGLSLIGMKNYYGYSDLEGNLYKNKFAKVTTIRLGYRHQKPTGGFMHRAGLLIPIAQDKFSESRVGDDIFFRLYLGFGLGYNF